MKLFQVFLALAVVGALSGTALFLMHSFAYVAVLVIAAVFAVAAVLARAVTAT